MSLKGHVWSIAARLARSSMPPSPPPSTDWFTHLDDPERGRVRLTGSLAASGPGSPLCVLVHGLGGCADSHYMAGTAASAAERGWSVLRLNLRGADRRGEDLYHAGLTADLHAALAAPSLAAYEAIGIVGFSLGGHMALLAATEGLDPRVSAVAAVCSPLDLEPCARALESRGTWLYRRYLLQHLKEIYTAVARERDVPIPVKQVDGISRLREFDDTVIASRFGFDGADDYYTKVSVGPRMQQLDLPTLVLHALDDPMVPFDTVRPFLEPAPSGAVVSRSPGGGHVAFSRRLDLGLGPARGMAGQVLGWLEAEVRHSSEVS